jgi:hypothetical protein
MVTFKRSSRSITNASTWKSYSAGDIEGVLVKCWQTIHEIGKQVKKVGFEMQVQEIDKQGKKYTHKYPNWKEFFNSDSRGDIFKNIIQKMSGFVAPGAYEPGILAMNHMLTLHYFRHFH